MSEGQLAQLWQRVEAGAGPLRGVLEQRTSEQQGYRIVDSITEFETEHAAVRVVFDGEGRVSGLFVLPVEQALPAAADASSAPPGVTEREVLVGGEPWSLPGTLVMPPGAGPFPGVVMVAGSGPQDRDETVGPNKPLRDLAWGLAARGIASLRYDKRTLVHRDRLVAGALEITVEEEVIADAAAAVELLAADQLIDVANVVLVGHSLGATLAPVIAERSGSVGGVVMLAPTARPLDRVIVAQLEYIVSLPGHGVAQERQMLEQVRAAASEYRAGGTGATGGLLGAPFSYYRDLEARDAVGTLARSAVPALLLFGSRDYQVTGEDRVLWERALRGRPAPTEIRELPGLNHLFSRPEGIDDAQPSAPEEYALVQRMSAAAIDAVADWVHRRTTPRR